MNGGSYQHPSSHRTGESKQNKNGGRTALRRHARYRNIAPGSPNFIHRDTAKLDRKGEGINVELGRPERSDIDLSLKNVSTVAHKSTIKNIATLNVCSARTLD